MNLQDAQIFVQIQNQSYDRAGRGVLESFPKSKALKAENFLEFLVRKRYGVLATTRSDGRAHAAPIGFTVWNGAFWIASVEGAKARNLRNRAWASIVIMEGEPATKHIAIIAEGSAKLYEGSEFARIRDKLIEVWEKKHDSKLEWANLLIELKPERIFSYDGSRKE
jgi:nitroimidazol reductase NimA-like FMN-containing flavoprotein (pyridoxamine 5'-phosphate oxidase superfamily)